MTRKRDSLGGGGGGGGGFFFKCTRIAPYTTMCTVKSVVLQYCTKSVYLDVAQYIAHGASGYYTHSATKFCCCCNFTYLVFLILGEVGLSICCE